MKTLDAVRVADFHFNNKYFNTISLLLLNRDFLRLWDRVLSTFIPSTVVINGEAEANLPLAAGCEHVCSFCKVTCWSVGSFSAPRGRRSCSSCPEGGSREVRSSKGSSRRAHMFIGSFLEISTFFFMIFSCESLSNKSYKTGLQWRLEQRTEACEGCFCV